LTKASTKRLLRIAKDQEVLSKQIVYSILDIKQKQECKLQKTLITLQKVSIFEVDKNE
jgi:hypothetical protein